MAKRRTSYFATYVLCLLCLIVGWFLGKRSSALRETHSILKNEGNSESAPKTKSEPVATEVNESPGTLISEMPDIDFSLSAGELLKQAEGIDDFAKRQRFLRTLITQWISMDPQYPQEEGNKFLAGMLPHPGFEHRSPEVVFSYYVSLLSDSNVRESWKSNFAHHPARSDLFTLFSAKDVTTVHPPDLIRMTEHWNAWEKERYHRTILGDWAQNEPSRAYAWYEANKSLFPSDTKNSIFERWAHSDFEGLTAHLDSILDSETRNAALDALAKEMAGRGTDGALDWANSLQSVDDQDLAHETIYRETPRGIGAVLRHEQGFPFVVEPLVANGLEPGDLIINARNGDITTEFYGKDLKSAVDVLLGTPGTDVTIQVLRPDPATGEYQQTEITITRQQLWMEGNRKEPPKP